METLRAITSLRVVRTFRDEPLPPDAIETILNAGRHAGSSKNLQRWVFITITERDRLQALSEVGSYSAPVGQAAVAIALITPMMTPDAPLSIMWDAGRAAQNMILAAWDLGIGSVPATVYKPEIAKRVLQYPDDRHCEYLLSFGYPADPTDLTRPARAGGRLPLDEIVRREQW